MLTQSPGDIQIKKKRKGGAFADEHDFSRWFVDALKRENIVVYAVESGSTGQGFPDLYCLLPPNFYPQNGYWVEGSGDGEYTWIELKNIKSDIWIELKNIKSSKMESVIKGKKQVPYRPGQLPWQELYNSRTGRKVLTVVACSDGILAISKTDFKTNSVTSEDLVYVVQKWGGEE